MSAQTDRELLELAAQAAGYDYECTSHTGHSEDDQHQIRNMEGSLVDWNPLTDDGDALRLAVKLRLLLNVSEDGVECMGESTEWLDESLGTDPVAATRRAIVRAAAALTQGA